jgi:hypothetical protein
VTPVSIIFKTHIRTTIIHSTCIEYNTIVGTSVHVGVRSAGWARKVAFEEAFPLGKADFSQRGALITPGSETRAILVLDCD